MKSLPVVSSVLAGLLFIPALASAQVVLTNSSLTYSENFDAPAGVTGNGNFAWTDNVTIPGWFSQDPSTGLESQFPGGISATQRVYSFRYTTADAGAGEGRAFGSRTTGAGTFSFAVGITNNTGGTLTGVDIDFVTAIWRTPANNTTDTLAVGYAITTAGAWTTLTYADIPELGESITQGGAGGGVNADPNGSGLFWDKSASLTGLNWADGDTLYIRFLDGNGAAAWGYRQLQCDCDS
ncbi:MAG: hypothetical protein LR015_01365 [Verrucomicrobia bacterium]|nr:hypothetical protein [Verrucomicrobiota bacterium]